MNPPSLIGQGGAILFGIAAIWMSQSANARTRRFSSIAGLASLPFFYYEYAAARQWGMVALNTVYLVAWVRGFWINWVSVAVARGDLK